MRVEIFRGEWEIITCAVRTDTLLALTTQNRNQPRYAPDTFDFELIGPSDELINYFLKTHTKTPVRAYTDDLVFLFEGDIQTGSVLDVDEGFTVLSLSAEDIVGRMDIPSPEDGWALLGNDLQTIAQNICNYCKVPHNFPIEMSQIIVEYFIIEGGEGRKNCLNVLDDLFYSRGYVLGVKYDGGSAVVSAYDWWNRDFSPTNSYPEIDCNNFLNPFQINVRRINYDILNVGWTIAGHFDRGHTERKDGLLLYQLGTDSKVPILPGDYYPERGNIEKVNFSYNTDFIKNRSDTKESDYSQSDLLISEAANPRETRIIYAWGQYIKYIQQAQSVKIPGGDSRPVVLVSGSPDIPPQLELVTEVHHPLFSQVVFKNRTKEIANLVKRIIEEHGGEDELNPNIDISEGWIVELRDFVILGNAVYSQGEGNKTVGIFSEGGEKIIDSVVTENIIENGNRRTVTKIFLKDGSSIQDFYKGYRVISDNGTNAIVNSYDASSKSLIIFDSESVSVFDTTNTRINLISPTEGVREESISSDFLFNQEDANKFAEGRRNEDVFGRFYYEYDSDLDHPKIGEYVKLVYDDFDVTNDVYGQVVRYEYSPDNKNNQRVGIQIKRINQFNPQATYPGTLINYPPLEQPPTTAGGFEIIRANTETKNLLPGQHPKNLWTYRTPGVAGGVEWRNYP